MNSSIELEGEFVRLRPLTVDDAAITFDWRQSQRAQLLNKAAPTVELQAKWISERPNSEYNFIIELKTGRPVGMLSLVVVDLQNRRAESARFLIGDRDAVKGIPAAVEAMLLLYKFAFDHLKLVRVYGTVVEENRLMLKWQKYLGMREEGRLRRHYAIGGVFQDAVCLSLLEDEYRRDALPRMKALIAAARSGLQKTA